nr:hypothetical protein [Cytophagales bacterium]
MFRKIALSLCFTLFLSLQTGCSLDLPLRLPKGESSAESTPIPPENSTENTKNDVQISQPVAIPPKFGDRPPEPGQTPTAYLPNGLPALKPMKGINPETLFSESIKNSDKRFDRVENAVVDLRKEFEVYKPSIVRLAAVESDIQNLIKELEVLLQETPANQHFANPRAGPDTTPQLRVEQLDPEPLPSILDDKEASEPPTALSVQDTASPAKPSMETEKPEIEKKDTPTLTPQSYDDTIAQNLRIGEHSDKVRLVIDTNVKTDFSIDLDNNEKLVVIELPKAKWQGDSNMSFKDSKLVESYVAEPLNDGMGTLLILSLKKTTKILSEKRLSPDATNGFHRIYFDLKL